jgi:hypothetical protein
VASRGGHGQQAWQFGGAVEKMLPEGKEFWRPARSETVGWLEQGFEVFLRVPAGADTGTLRRVLQALQTTC